MLSAKYCRFRLGLNVLEWLADLNKTYPVPNFKSGARLCLVAPVQVNSLRPSDAYMRQ